jgi:lipoprotein-anchoring transpeptidase ErfK/SrfK
MCVVIAPLSASASVTGSYPSVRFMRDAPNDNATVIKNIPADTRLTVELVEGTDYAKTTYKGITGYVKHLKFIRESGGASSASSSVSAAKSDYYLFLNKSTHTLTVYRADENGRRTDTVVRSITTAIGKRSTPTPSGKFTLTTRETWHSFGSSYAPFAVRYASGKYLHGPLYKSKDIDTVISSSVSGIGKNVTGGCLRMSYTNIKWIYDNCISGTILEIVNGE